MVKKVFRQMTASQIASSVTVTVCLLVDSIVIGRLLGVDAMSAYGLANPVIIIFNALGTMTAVGVQVLVGKAMGRGDREGCKVCFSSSVALSVAVAAIWMLIVFAATRPICLLLGARGEELIGMTGAYLRGYILGAPFFFLSQIITPYLQVMGKRHLTFIIVIAMTVSDVVLDLVSVYVFHSGMFGIGFASGVSYLTATVVALLASVRGYFLQKDCPFRFHLNAVHLKTMWDIAVGGSPILANQAFFTVRVYVMNQILLSVAGSVAVAALSVISTIGNIIFSIGLGAGSIALTLSSIFYSEEDRTSLYGLVRVMISYSLKLIVTVIAVMLIAAPWLIRLFLGSDPYVVQMATLALRLYGAGLIACVLYTVLKNYYQGTGRVTFTNVISFADNIGIMLPVTWLFSKLMGLTGVWIGMLVAQCGVLLMIAVVVWVRRGRVSLTAEDFSLLSADFGAAPEDVCEMSVTDLPSAIAASEGINAFCADKGLGKRMTMLMSLCVEEIVVNIVEHGFTKDSKAHSADVRLVVHEDNCIVRVRDNCVTFDPIHYMELHQSDDPMKHIGIRMVMAMVSDINYINSLGLNNLYMRIDRK